MKNALIRYYGFPAAIVGLLVSIILPVFPAYASTSITASSPDQTRTQSYAYYQAMRTCIADDEMNHDIGSTDANTPKNWRNWQNNAPVQTDFSIYSSGSTDCNVIFPDALSFWGYNPETFLQDMGYTLNKAGTTYSVGSSKTLGQKFQDVLQSKNIYITPDSNVKYDLLLAAYTNSNGCQAKSVGTLSSEPDSIATLAKNNSQGNDNYWYAVINKLGGSPTVYKTNIPNYKNGTATGKDTYANTASAYVSTNGTVLCKNFPSAINSASAAAQKDISSGAVVKPVGGDGSSACTAGNTDSSCSTTTCAIDGIGWILCPVMNFMGGIVDAAYGFVSSLLQVQPLNTTDSTSGTFGAWSIMRNIANVAFVLVFLIIIFSQITNWGVSNYGIKKMLPKLIVSAILVNLSYYICAIAVDLSNILGASLNGIMNSLSAKVQSPSFSDVGATGAGWAGIVGFILAGGLAAGTTMYIGLAALLPALIAALLAIITVFLVLTLRQALIILLIVIAPLAFVAFLLPNTESLFKKWRELFQTLLLMYPIIALIFGASAFASKVVMASAVGNYKIAIEIMGALIAILPLAITPLVMKTAGSLLGKFGGAINNPNKGPFDRMRKRAGSYRDRRQDMRAARAADGRTVFGRGQFRRKARRDFINNGAKNARARAEQQYTADLMTDENGKTTSFATKAAGGGAILGADPAALQRALAGAQFTIDKAEAEDIQAESVTVRNMDSKSLKGELANSTTSDARKAAAMQRLVTIADPGDVLDENGNIKSEGYARQVNEAMRGSEILRRATAEALAKNGPKFIKASDIDMIATGRHKQRDGTQSTLQSIAFDNVKNGVYSEEKMVDETSGNLTFAYASADSDGKQRMTITAAALKDNPTLSGKIKHNAQIIDELASMAPPTQPPSAAQPNNPPAQTPPQPSSPPPSPMSNYAPRENGPNNFNVPHDMK